MEVITTDVGIRYWRRFQSEMSVLHCL